MSDSFARDIRRRDRERHKLDRSCYICKQTMHGFPYELITHVHHMIEVADIRKLLDLAESQDKSVSILHRTVCLCPNHHALVHFSMKHNAYPADVKEDWAGVDAFVKEQRQMVSDCVSDFVIKMTPPLKLPFLT